VPYYEHCESKKYTPIERGGKLKKTVEFLKVAIDF
jgi:hypothetical protein